MSRQVTVHKKVSARYISEKKTVLHSVKTPGQINDQVILKLGKRSEQAHHQREDRSRKQA